MEWVTSTNRMVRDWEEDGEQAVTTINQQERTANPIIHRNVRMLVILSRNSGLMYRMPGLQILFTLAFLM